jgi:anti-sigma regulatory factor (Ser/Thr protein kinase)
VSTGPTLELKVTSTPGEIGKAHRALIRFLEDLGVEAETVSAVALLVEEAVVNVFRYGFENEGVHVVHVTLEPHPTHVLLGFQDDGREFDPCSVPPPDLAVPCEDRPIGGLGIHLMRNLADRMEYRRTAGQNHLTLRVPRPGTT